MVRMRTRIRELTPRGRCHQDFRRVIADVNQALRGWGAYFRTGNAAVKFVQIDRYVVERLRGLRLKQHGASLRPGRAAAWERPFFEALGLYRLGGTIHYPGYA
jgi:RNA-directed DNA polymerase